MFHLKGILSTRNGKFQIGSVLDGYVGLEQQGNDINFDFNNVNTFRNITLIKIHYYSLIVMQTQVILLIFKVKILTF